MLAHSLLFCRNGSKWLKVDKNLLNVPIKNNKHHSSNHRQPDDVLREGEERRLHRPPGNVTEFVLIHLYPCETEALLVEAPRVARSVRKRKRRSFCTKSAIVEQSEKLDDVGRWSTGREPFPRCEPSEGWRCTDGLRKRKEKQRLASAIRGRILLHRLVRRAPLGASDAQRWFCRNESSFVS